MVVFPKPDVEQFLRTFSVRDFAVSPDESQLVFSTNLSGKSNVWAMNFPSHFPVQLTFNDQDCAGLMYEPNGQFILAGFDEDGDENTQYYAFPPQGGTLANVVYEAGTRNMSPHLSKDGARLYYSSSKGNPQFMNTYVQHIETGEQHLLLEGKEALTAIEAVSPNEETLLYVKFYANTYSLLYAKQGDTHIRMTPDTDEQHTVDSPVFVGEELVYFLTNYDADFTYLASFDLRTKAFQKVKALEKQNFNVLKYDEVNDCLYIVSEQGVEERLYTFDLKTEELLSMPAPCSIFLKLVVAKTGTLYALGGSATKAFNIFKLEDGQWVRLTNYQVPGIAEEALVEPDVVTYESFDGLPIEALFFKAKEENANGKIIFWPHGGPQASEQKFFRAAFQFFLYNGYHIFAPNFRGSTGYGLAFSKMVEGDWGHGPRLDNVAGLDWLIAEGYANKGDIFLMGGSYGGYMALLLHGRHSEYFKAVVDIFGPCDLFSFYHSVPEDWKPIMNQWVGDPVKDRDKFIEDSPITHIAGMTKPMFVVQGANDPRVVQAESDKIVAALKKEGRDVSYLLLPDEGHGFSKKENEIDVYRQILAFFNRFQ